MYFPPCVNVYFISAVTFLIVPSGQTRSTLKEGFASISSYTFAAVKFNVSFSRQASIFSPPYTITGAIVPLASQQKENGTPNPECLIVKVFNGIGNFELYEDDRENNSKNEFFTTFETTEKLLKNGNMIQTLKITSRGDNKVIPSSRKLSVRFENIDKGEIQLKINGEIAEAKKKHFDCVAIDLNFSANTEYELTITFTPIDKIEEWKKRATKILSATDGRNDLITECNEKILQLKDMSGINNFVFRNVYLPDVIVERMKETL